MDCIPYIHVQTAAVPTVYRLTTQCTTWKVGHSLVTEHARFVCAHRPAGTITLYHTVYYTGTIHVLGCVLCSPYLYIDSGICTSTARGIAGALDPPLTYSSVNNPGTSSTPHMLETLDSGHPNKKMKMEPFPQEKQQNEKSKNLCSKKRKGGANADPHKSPCINVETYIPSVSEESIAKWIPELSLHLSDKQQILSPVGWLTDSIIDAAQALLKRDHPHLSGLQTVSKGLTMSYDVQPREFVQILNNGRGHWLVVSTVDSLNNSPSFCEVKVYDSMHSSVNDHIKAQVASIMSTECSTIHLSFMDVQMQSGGYDCGLFAVAFVTALAFNKQPGQYLFDQQQMRKHLWKCLDRKKIEMFPVKKLRRSTAKVKSTDFVPIFCLCRMPELPNTQWIECPKCKEWFHLETCVQVPKSNLAPTGNCVDDWYCNACQ